MNHSTVGSAKTSPAFVQGLEGYLRRLMERIEQQQTPNREPGRGPGAPAKLPSAALWTGLLLCVLWKVKSLRAVWRYLRRQGFAICDQTVYDRLEVEETAPLQALFAQISSMLQAWLTPLVQAQSWAQLAPFASEVLALDETTLDAVARRLPQLRPWHKGAVELLPGKLAGLFDVRLQLWRRIDYLANPLQNAKVHARQMLEGLREGSLLLFDLGYFSFEWLDEVTSRHLWWIARVRAKTSYSIVHVFYQSETLFDGLIFLGTYEAKARYAVRLVRWQEGAHWLEYVTNVLDPQVLSMRDVARLYARRWDIELAFLTLKQYLGLHLLWTSKVVHVLQQIWACLILAQLLQALRMEIACAAGVEAFEVSLPLVLEELPHLLAGEEELVAAYVHWGRDLGIIRPSSRLQVRAPQLPLDQLRPRPAHVLLERQPCYPHDPGQPGRKPSKKQSAARTSARGAKPATKGGTTQPGAGKKKEATPSEGAKKKKAESARERASPRPI